MFGRQGMAQSQNCAFEACMLCGASIRVSYFVPAMLCFQLFQDLAEGAAGGQWLLLTISLTLTQFILLYITVLTHEFGHGTMARWLGGRIDHILLWPFGGICFSTRPEERDPRTLVKNDLKVVAAGPATHIPQTIFWVLVSACLVWMINAFACDDIGPGCIPCEGTDCFFMALNPFRGAAVMLLSKSMALYFVLQIPLIGITLNIGLFLFNVFFPMYPADGAKLLVCTLMYCCKVRPYKAALILIICSGSCAILLIAWAVYSFQARIGASLSGAGGGSGYGMFSGTLPGFLGLMALQETYQIWQLRQEQRLSEHPYFRAARTDVTRTRDEHGFVATLNATGRDNPNQAFGNTSGEEDGQCCLYRCFCGWQRQRQVRAQEISVRQTAPDQNIMVQMRQDRTQFLTRFDQPSPTGRTPTRTCLTPTNSIAPSAPPAEA
mmetsp:Transcript_4753/g.8138  ORF Transcript_4753/g.8138 Transcript_4753/m.8138 type:complete len:436 (-) Transcript_4753:95-1402(-)